jgi:hypothetical protein
MSRRNIQVMYMIVSFCFLFGVGMTLLKGRTRGAVGRYLAY